MEERELKSLFYNICSNKKSAIGKCLSIEQIRVYRVVSILRDGDINNITIKITSLHRKKDLCMDHEDSC